MFLSHINICISISKLSFRVFISFQKKPVSLSLLLYGLPQPQSVSLRLRVFHIKLEGGTKIKISVVLVGPSVEKRKMFHVYYYTDISLVVGLYDLRLDRL